jgi:hypothetical protein
MTPEYDAVNPNTDPARLAELAQTHPHLRPIIAANPAAYDGLLQWLTQFDEPGLKSTLASRGYAAAPVVAEKKRRVPLAAIIAIVIGAVLLVGGGVTALVIALNQPSTTSSSSKDDKKDKDEAEEEDEEDTDEDNPDADDETVDGIPTCTIDQVLSVFYGDVDPDTVDLAGSFTLPEVLDASTTTICAGDYLSSDPEAYKQATSVAVLEDDGKVIERLSEILRAGGFGEPLESGMGTTGWTDGVTQVFALNLEDAVYTDTDEFGGIDDKIIVFVWEA